jgi:CheY-like chemotaxis protein
MPDGGELWLSSDGEPVARDDGGPFHCLRVRDTGAGMDRATLERVFDPFFTTKPTGHGTGLGLPMVYSLMREQGGRVDVRSEPGQGTEVLLFFPVAAAAAAEQTIDVHQPLPTGRETILFAEDESALLSAAQRGLARLGYRVLPAQDGAEALRLFHEHEGEIDLVISDSVMPRLGGADVYEVLRRREPPIRFLMASGYSPGAGLRDRPTVAVPFLRKPYTLTELAYRVREVLDAGNGDVTEVATRGTA